MLLRETELDGKYTKRGGEINIESDDNTKSSWRDRVDEEHQIVARNEGLEKGQVPSTTPIFVWPREEE